MISDQGSIIMISSLKQINNTYHLGRMTSSDTYPPYLTSSYKHEPDTEPEDNVSIVLRSTDNLPPLISKRTKKLKSSLCKNYISYGYCPYGSKCQFAHGPEELRCNDHLANTSYKTKTCFHFVRKGECPYGQRCNYLHPTQSERNQNICSRLLSNFPGEIQLYGSSSSRLVNIVQKRSVKQTLIQ